jgi:hypothetical protein
MRRLAVLSLLFLGAIQAAAQQTASAPPEAATDLQTSGFASHWKSVTTGSIQVLTFSGDYIRFETIFPKAAAQAGAYARGELKHDPATGGYLGKFSSRVMSAASNPGASCDFTMMIELTLVTKDRIEGRKFMPPRGSKIDFKTCQFNKPKDWQEFTWKPAS